MVHPSNIFLPFLLLGLVLLRLLWTRQLHGQWLSVAAAGAIPATLLIAYVALNDAHNGIEDLSYAPNVTLLGKVLEYDMEDLPADPRYRDVQAAVSAFARAGGRDPWIFRAQHPQLSGVWFARAGDYARSIIAHNSSTYVWDSLHDLLTTWRAPPAFYALEGAGPDGKLPHDETGAIPDLNSYLNVGHAFATPPVNEPLWVTALLDLSTLEQLAFLLLPLLLVLLGVWLWRHPGDVQAFVMLALLGAVLGTMVMAAFGNYSEFYRIRSPMDWGMIAVGGIIVLEALSRLARRGQRAQALPEPGVGRATDALS
jgi:hypothetical protein